MSTPLNAPYKLRNLLFLLKLTARKYLYEHVPYLGLDGKLKKGKPFIKPNTNEENLNEQHKSKSNKR